MTPFSNASSTQLLESSHQQQKYNKQANHTVAMNVPTMENDTCQKRMHVINMMDYFRLDLLQHPGISRHHYGIM